ncbi:MAG: Dyp-type peroxidase [Thermomicrobiales bacterium]
MRAATRSLLDRGVTMSRNDRVTLELDDIQAGVLRGRPTPYAGALLLLRIDDPASGRALAGRLAEVVPAAADLLHPETDASISVAFTHEGLRALGVPRTALESFPPAFREGMAARAALLGDVGPEDPATWEAPLGSDEVHVIIVLLAPDVARFETELATARAAIADLPGITFLWRQEVWSPPDGRNALDFRDGISQPDIAGSGIPPSNPLEPPVRPGEFVLGYENETGSVTPMPQPDVLGRNGSYLVFRKLAVDVAGFRRYVRREAPGATEAERVAAKIMGRWPSGAPLALAPDADDPALGADDSRNNIFLYGDDEAGLKCPAGSHARRTNPRDAPVLGSVRLHRILRRSATYGPRLHPGSLEDDGADRGLLLIAVNAHIDRQFEFVQSHWINDGRFIGEPDEVDPLAAPHAVHDTFTIPQRPIRKRLRGLPTFVRNRGGHYGFIPSRRALRWLAELGSTALRA